MGKGNFLQGLVGVGSTAILEKGVEVTKGDQIKHLRDPILGPYPKTAKSGLQKYLSFRAYHSTFHTLQTHMSRYEQTRLDVHQQTNIQLL